MSICQACYTAGQTVEHAYVHVVPRLSGCDFYFVQPVNLQASLLHVLPHLPGNGDHCAYLENGGTIENAQAIAAHESPRTTKLYDRTSDEITLHEVEPIVI